MVGGFSSSSNGIPKQANAAECWHLLTAISGSSIGIVRAHVGLGDLLIEEDRCGTVQFDVALNAAWRGHGHPEWWMREFRLDTLLSTWGDLRRTPVVTTWFLG
jgi:hypothetical protein